jgi:hypothetical protein
MQSPRVSRELILRWLMDCVIFGFGMAIGASCWRHGKPSAVVSLLWLLGGVLTLFAARLASSRWLTPAMTRYGWILRGAACVCFALGAADFWRRGDLLGAVLYGLAFFFIAILVVIDLAERRRRRDSAPVASRTAA